MDEDDFDIYGDLEDVDYKAENEKLQTEIEQLKQKLAEVQSRCSELLTTNVNLKNKEVTYEKNFSSLLLTARTEVDRKDRQIEEIRKKTAGGGGETKKTAPIQGSKATQTYEQSVRKDYEHKSNGGGRKRSRSPIKDNCEPAKRQRNHSDDRRRDERSSGRQHVEKRRDEEHKRGEGRSQRRDDSRSRRRSCERYDDRGSKEKRNSEVVKKVDDKQAKSGQNSPAKAAAKKSKDKATPQAEKPDEAKVNHEEQKEKPVEPKENPKEPIVQPTPPEEKPAAPPIPHPPAALPQSSDKCDQPIAITAPDAANKAATLNIDLATEIDGPSICSRPSETDGTVDDPQTPHQQLSIDLLSQLPDAPITAKSDTLDNENLNTSEQSGRHYVIEVVNENEIECFVSLNRKKKRKKDKKVVV